MDQIVCEWDEQTGKYTIMNESLYDEFYSAKIQEMKYEDHGRIIFISTDCGRYRVEKQKGKEKIVKLNGA